MGWPANSPMPGATIWTTPASLTPSRRTRSTWPVTGATRTRTSETTSPAYLNYVIPAFGRGPKALTQGWEVNGILKFQNGEPVNVLTGQDNSGTAEGEDRANITGPAINSDRSVQSARLCAVPQPEQLCRAGKLAPTAIWAATRSSDRASETWICR